jgi:hypothetical protein
MGLVWIGIGIGSALALEPGTVDGLTNEDSGLDRPEFVEFASGDSPWGIINGEEATEDDYPMTGGMLMDARMSFGGSGTYDIRSFVCSSTLIAPDVVLLAAHCIDPYAMTYGMGDLEDVDIRWSRQADLSDHDGSTVADWPADAVPAWDWVMHTDWDMTAMGMGLSENHDIALIFLDEPVLDTPHAYLVSADEATQLQVGVEVDVVGWGQQVATGMWEQPPAGSYGYKIQGTSFINELAETEFQVGAVESDVRKCHGDSGGPSFMHVDADSEESLRLIGVTSHAYDTTDCDSTGGVDTRVDAYLGWIESELVSRCEDGTRAWCDQSGIVVAPLPVVSDDLLEEEEGRFGLGCSARTGLPTSWSGWALAMLGLVGLRRRRVSVP